jgi:hypothetical protein
MPRSPGAPIAQSRRGVSTSSFERPFIPSGVSPSVWLGFEGRVRQRRFHALVDSIEKAIARGDLDAAALALDEAESLQPHAPQLAGVRATLTRLSAPNPMPHSWKRPLSAILLPIIGMILLTFADSLRHRDAESATLGPPMTSAGVPLSVPGALVVQSPEPPPSALPSELLLKRSSTTSTMGEHTPRAVPTALLASTSLLTADRDMSVTAPLLERPRQPITRAPAPAPAPPTAVTVAPSSVLLNEPVAATPLPEPLAPPPTAAPAITEVPESLDRRDVTATLNAYAHAFAQLDARAARAVWPSVDERALARAFSGLTSQDIAFADCAIHVNGARADAACHGTASYVAKVGKDDRRVEPRTWQFQLERDGDAWKIATAEARRPQ